MDEEGFAIEEPPGPDASENTTAVRVLCWVCAEANGRILSQHRVERGTRDGGWGDRRALGRALFSSANCYPLCLPDVGTMSLKEARHVEINK